MQTYYLNGYHPTKKHYQGQDRRTTVPLTTAENKGLGEAGLHSRAKWKAEVSTVAAEIDGLTGLQRRTMTMVEEQLGRDNDGRDMLPVCQQLWMVFGIRFVTAGSKDDQLHEALHVAKQFASQTLFLQLSYLAYMLAQVRRCILVVVVVVVVVVKRKSKRNEKEKQRRYTDLAVGSR
jgi:hypothetical protein